MEFNESGGNLKVEVAGVACVASVQKAAQIQFEIVIHLGGDSLP
jgi:hypothetical protein